MLKKSILAAIAATALMVAVGTPASAAMLTPNPSVEAATASTIIEARFRGGGRRFGGHRFGGRRFGHRRWHHRRWHHRRWGHRYGWRRYRYGRWAAYRRCMWKQDQGYRIYCPRPGHYY